MSFSVHSLHRAEKNERKGNWKKENTRKYDKRSNATNRRITCCTTKIRGFVEKDVHCSVLAKSAMKYQNNVFVGTMMMKINPTSLKNENQTY